VRGGFMKTGLKVIDAMTKEPISVSPEDSVKNCAELMKKNHVGSVVVLKNEKLLGIISEQDFVYKVIAKDKDVYKTKAKDIMTTDPVTITPDIDIFNALVKMRDSNVRRLPVIDGEKLVGFLTSKDVLKIEPQLFELIVDKIELREEKNKPIHRIGDNEGLCSLCGEYTDFLYEEDGVMVCENCRD
jgi:CBS domain-containing protein